MSKILIIAPNWIGDAVMTEPLIRRLKTLHPESDIDVLATPWVASVMRAIPAVKQIICADFQHGLLQWHERKQLAKKLKKEAYAKAYILPNSFKSALIPWMASIPERYGYLGEMRWGLITHPLKNPSKAHRPPMSLHYQALGDVQTKETPVPHLEISKPILELMQARLSMEANYKNLYVLCPGAEYGPAKQWPTEHYAQLALELAEKNSQNLILILGSKKESSIGDQICSLSAYSNQVLNWCGKTSLDEAMACISLATGVVSNDSGLMHIAAALEKPQVALFGSSDPRHTPPLSKKAQIHWLHLECSPCFKRTCPLGHMKCLVDISVKDVLNSLITSTK
jgi:heptosyltransferase II